jgi:hypothetical protein
MGRIWLSDGLLVQVRGHLEMERSRTVKTLLAAVFIFMTTATVTGGAAGSDQECPDIAGLTIIGELENVTLKSQGLRLKARIDTGAKTSSLGVLSHQTFERDGKKWLHFAVQDPDSDVPVRFERPLLRIASIKRHGAEAMDRPVVSLKLMLGAIEVEREFTLADRAQYKYPVLIGRNVLAGKFLVDVNRKYSAAGVGVRER